MTKATAMKDAANQQAEGFSFAGDFVLVRPVPGVGFAVLQAHALGHDCRPVEVLAIFPPAEAPERARPKFNPDAPVYRRTANRFARDEANERNLPVWTAAAGKGGT